MITMKRIYDIYNNRFIEKDAPYGPGAPATEIIESDPMEPELQLDNERR